MGSYLMGRTGSKLFSKDSGYTWQVSTGYNKKKLEKEKCTHFAFQNDSPFVKEKFCSITCPPIH
jgi:hypothetical protein